MALIDIIIASASNPSKEYSWWKSLWKLNIPPKVKIFIWQACLNAIPSKENLWKKKVVSGPCCDRCASHVETSSYALFGYKKARLVWRESRFGNLLANLRTLFMLDVLSLLAGKIAADDLNLVCMISWAIWENHNFFLNNGKARDSDLVVCWALELMGEFMNSKRALSPISHSPPIRRSSRCLGCGNCYQR
ncbi:hypothetical protein Dsin_001269 [Dipteronia sinensis]|uniref:Reverse transcriptase zinc-binding domain-containing protein n=1 Tax=Dipteronia sinensis TaxID=43782 RepID=A0AAE0EI72_9ROSI|nr:hypothetical protein Dsin_001269 [Dipteronia sinensis]